MNSPFRRGNNSWFLFLGLISNTGKAKVINRALQDIGMGRYQWQLFFLCGFGWTADK